MAGWVWLPRFVDKIRLHITDKLHTDYQPNFCVKGFDLAWLKKAGLEGDDFVELVKNTTTDGEVCDWVVKNVQSSDSDRAEFQNTMENYGRDKSDTDLQALLQKRKGEAGMGNRDDIQCFVDFIDADEGRI